MNATPTRRAALVARRSCALHNRQASLRPGGVGCFLGTVGGAPRALRLRLEECEAAGRADARWVVLRARARAKSTPARRGLSHWGGASRERERAPLRLRAAAHLRFRQSGTPRPPDRARSARRLRDARRSAASKLGVMVRFTKARPSPPPAARARARSGARRAAPARELARARARSRSRARRAAATASRGAPPAAAPPRPPRPRGRRAAAARARGRSAEAAPGRRVAPARARARARARPRAGRVARARARDCTRARPRRATTTSSRSGSAEVVRGGGAAARGMAGRGRAQQLVSGNPPPRRERPT